MIKDTKIKDYQEYITTYSRVVESCVELLTTLETHKGKLVDNRFFKKHFTISNEYRDWTKYSFGGKAYEWDKYNYTLYLGSGNNGERLELQTRETVELVEKLKERHKTAFERIEEHTQAIEKLQAFDEKALIADIVAVYKKHGKPEIWGKVLDAYEVKYPQK